MISISTLVLINKYVSTYQQGLTRKCMASGKNALKINQRFKNDITKTYYQGSNATKNAIASYVHSNKPNTSKFALQRILKFSSAQMILSHGLPDCRPACCKTRQHQAQGSSFFSQSMYNRRIHESAVPKKIHPLRHDLSFHPLLFGFLLKKRREVAHKR